MRNNIKFRVIPKIGSKLIPVISREGRGGQKIGSGFFLMLLLILASCSSEPEALQSRFVADVSVADSIDQTGDFSGFNFLIFSRASINDPIDTLLYVTTDKSGHTEGNFKFERAGSYPVQITRNGRNIASLQIWLAENDTTHLTGEFPAFDKTYNIDSREQDAMEVYNRVEAAFARTNTFILNGKIPEDEIGSELQKFVDLYWEVFTKNPGSFASKFALERAITLLNTFDEEQMFEKLQQAFSDDYAFGLAATIGKEYVADYRGLDATVAYLDSVKTLTKKEDIHRVLDQAVIKLQLDSLNIDQARQLLTSFEKNYENPDEYTFWYKNMRFELYDLTPGEPVPAFSFETVDGDTISNESLLGKPYILEFSLMANQLYQSQYEKSTVIYQLYAPQGLQYVTIPFDESSNTIVGFFQERDRFWDIANPPSVDRKKMTEEFNIHFFPTRVLVDAEGNMNRKFIGEEFDGIIPAITQTLK